MKILSFRAEQFKRLQVIEITPEGHVVELVGKNKQGKSSILDAIEAVLGGGKRLPDVPIRKGEKAARIEVKIGNEKVELVVERTFDAKGSYLQISSASGAIRSSPQTILNAMLGAMTFDPYEFVTMPPAEQFAALRVLVGIDKSVFEELDGLNKRDFNARTDAGREAASLKAQAEAIVIADGLPETVIDTQAILDELTQVSHHNSGIDREERRRAAMFNKAQEYANASETWRSKAAELRAQAERCDEEAKTSAASAASTTAELAALPAISPPKDSADVRAKLTAAEETNRKIAARERRAALLVDAEAKQTKVTELSTAIDARKKAKQDAITAAKMPIEGLGLGDGHVTFNDLPFDQASDAEQLRISVAIAMAANPTLRVIRIKEGAFLDDDGMRLIAAMAKEHDYQVWVESVKDHGGPAIVIEDGHVRAPELHQPKETTEPQSSLL